MAVISVMMIGRVDVCFSDIKLIMSVTMGRRVSDTHMKRRRMRSGRRKRKQEHANDGRKSSHCIEISVFRATHHPAHIDALGDLNKIPD